MTNGRAIRAAAALPTSRPGFFGDFLDRDHSLAIDTAQGLPRQTAQSIEG